ncbi:MAG TPA: hypothetical protein VK395_32380 [Gemmataceae bacterium]|nr:hypothetical protein [Gemmataceae bacterium]
MRRKLKTSGIMIADDFPVDLYHTIHFRVCLKRGNHSTATHEYSGSWNSVAYRFRACAEHGNAFIKSVRRAGESPRFAQRFVQERELFNFFVNGISSIETFYYSMFAIASMMSPPAFPLTSHRDKKK